MIKKLNKETISKIRKNSKQFGIIILFLVISSLVFSFVSLDGTLNQRLENDEVKNDDSILEAVKLKTSNSQEMVEWWNASFAFRRRLNVTNYYDVDLINHTASVEFNFTELVAEGKMNDTLKDVRIVENGVLRNYFVLTDYPAEGNATVWFETDCLAETTEDDVYLYYGNNTVERANGYYNKDNRFGVAWWRFDDGGPGATASDSIGTTDGTRVNMDASNWVPGREGKYALQFDGNNEYVNIPSGPNPTEQITVSAWVKSAFSSYYSGTYWQIVSKYSAYILGTGSANSARMCFIVSTQSGGWRYMSGYTVPDPDEWHHFIGTFNYSGGVNSVEKLYVDGELMSTQPTSGGQIRADTGSIHIAKREISGTPAYHFAGIIDDVKIYDHALSDYEARHLYNRTSISTILLPDEESQFTDVKVITQDVDGRIVPNTIVSLINTSAPIQIIETLNTSDDGSVVFENLTHGVYNFTVKYKLDSGVEIVVYNSTKSNFGKADGIWNMYNFSGLFYTQYIELNMTTIDFQIVDWSNNNNPLNSGYVNVSSSEGSPTIEKLKLDNDGLATFRYYNMPSFYYEVYYDNDDYKGNPKSMNASTIYRTDYTQNEKFYSTTILVNKTNIEVVGNNFQVNQFIYTNRSSTIYKRLLKANISLRNMEDSLDSVEIYYIDKDGNSPDEYLISQKIYSTTTTDDLLYIDIRKPNETCDDLILDNYQAYGIRVEVKGSNSTGVCNGTIEVNTTETWNVFNRTDLAKITLKVVDDALGIPIEDVFIRVNGTGAAITGESFVNLTTDSDGFAHGLKNSDIEFWHKIGYEYNFTFYFYNDQKTITVTDTDPSQWVSATPVYDFNITLNQYSKINITLFIDLGDYTTNFTQGTGPSVVTHGDTMTFSVNFTFKTPTTSGIITNPTEIKCQVKSSVNLQILFTNDTMKYLGKGVYEAKINSSLFSAGNSSLSYWVEISGRKIGYTPPGSHFFPITINAKQAAISVHKYNGLAEYKTMQTSVNALNTIKLAVKYHSSGTSITGATLSYSWQFGSGDIDPDSKNPGYYTFEIDSSLATNVGKYEIEISAYYENYTKQESIGFDLNILRRPTLINGTNSLLHNSSIIWVQDSHNYTYKFVDSLTSAKIGSADKAYYYWYKIDEYGAPIGAPSDYIDLVETASNKYFLDFNTEIRSVGSYAIFLTFEKNYYETRNAYIDLRINKRKFSATLSPEKFDDNIISVYNGDPLLFNISLRDDTRNKPLKGATVKMDFQNETYTFTEKGGGGYSINITDYTKLTANDISNTSTTSITISKANFTTKTIDITVILSNKRFNITLSEQFEGQLLTIVSGNLLSFNININDSSTASALLDATITIKIQGVIYEDVSFIDNGNGTYTITLRTYPDAFFTSETITGEIIIEKDNFKTESISFTVEIEMVEVIPGTGFPMFYFLMIVISVGAVVGSLVSYRYIQLARIPTFVKDVRKMKGEIKGRKQISESLEYPSKDEYIAKKLGDKWEMLGISLTDILGIEVKKVKTLPEVKETIKKPKITPEEKAKKKADKEAEAKRKAEEKAKLKAEKEVEAKRKAEEKAKLKAEKEAEKEAEAKRKTEEKAKQQAEKETEAKRKAEEKAKQQTEKETESKKEAQEEAKGGEE